MNTTRDYDRASHLRKSAAMRRRRAADLAVEVARELEQAERDERDAAALEMRAAGAEG